jgi:uncharacterized damage-inducible protein DinB
MGRRLQEIIGNIQDSRAKLLAAVSGLGQEALGRRPAPDQWSIGENLHHLQLIESSVTRLLEKQVARAARIGLGADLAQDSVLGSLDRFSIDSNPLKVAAPESVAPTRGLARQDLLDGLSASRAALLSEAEKADAFDLGRLHAPHPVLGRMDMYQWVLYLGQHEVRHLRQIERALSH